MSKRSWGNISRERKLHANSAPYPYTDTLCQLRRRLAEQAEAEVEEFDRSKENCSEFRELHWERLKDTAWRLAQVHSAIIEHEKLRIWERVAGSIISEVGVVGRKMEALPAMLDELLSRFSR